MSTSLRFPRVYVERAIYYFLIKYIYDPQKYNDNKNKIKGGLGLVSLSLRGH